VTVLVEIPRDQYGRSRTFAAALVAVYQSGRNENSRAYAMDGIDKDVEAQAQARAAECALCQYLQIPAEMLNWGTDRPDHGCDLIVGDLELDCKRSHWGGRRLIWPISKNPIFHSKRFTHLVFVRGEDTTFEIVGWIGKQEFFEQKEIAPVGHPLKAGTWFVPREKLTDPSELLRLVQERESV
jgi:hypothetical protein